MNRDKIEKISENQNLSDSDRSELRSLLNDKACVLPGWDPKFLTLLRDVKTVVDVGVLDGTPELYAAFPDAYLVLVEALPPYEPACQKILSNRPGEYHICALSDEAGNAEIKLIKRNPGLSTMLRATWNMGEFETFHVSKTRMDDLFAGKSYEKSILLKIDTEGMEYRILKGGPKFLTNVKYIVAETAIQHRHHDSYRFADLVGLLKDAGFDLFDVLRVTRRGVGRPGADIMDAVFMRTNAKRA